MIMGNGLTRTDKTENGGRPSMSATRFSSLHFMICCGRKVWSHSNNNSRVSV